MSADTHAVDASFKAFGHLYESMKTDWADRRAHIQPTLKRWAEDHGKDCVDLLYQRLCGWADAILLREYSTSAESGSISQTQLFTLRVDDRDFWISDVRELVRPEFADSRDALYKTVFGARGEG